MRLPKLGVLLFAEFMAMWFIPVALLAGAIFIDCLWWVFITGLYGVSPRSVLFNAFPADPDSVLLARYILFFILLFVFTPIVYYFKQNTEEDRV